jgi:hypothetical protein
MHNQSKAIHFLELTITSNFGLDSANKKKQNNQLEKNHSLLLF